MFESLGTDLSWLMTHNRWLWPVCETLHFIGLGIVVGTIGAINLRILGVLKNLSFEALHGLLPLSILGFCINLITGMMFFIGTPYQYVGNIAFNLKVGFIMIAGVNLLYFTVSSETWALGPGEDAPIIPKMMGVVSLFLWAGVIYFGRMLPFMGQSF